MSILTAFVLMLLCGVLDRLRGDSRQGFLQPLETWCYGALLALASGVDDWRWLGLAGLAFIAGESAGWGNVISACLARYELDPRGAKWWQVGALKRDKWAAAVARGLLWGIPLIPLTYWAPELWRVVIAIGVAFPLSLAICRHLSTEPLTIWGWQLAADRWGKMEVVRGLLACILALLLACV